MTTSKEFLTVPLIRKYGSMPSLAQKSMISLEYKDSSLPRRVSGGSDPPKTGNKQTGPLGNLELPQVRWLVETPAKNDHGSNFRREIGWRSPLLEQRQTSGVRQETDGVTTTPNMEKTAPESPGRRGLDEQPMFLPSRHSEWLNRISSLNERLSGVNTTSSKTVAQTTGNNKVTNTGQKARGGQPRKSQFRRKTNIPKKTVLTHNETEKYSPAFSVEKELYFQDYRQKCIQWLKSLPDTEAQPMNLR